MGIVTAKIQESILCFRKKKNQSFQEMFGYQTAVSVLLEINILSGTSSRTAILARDSDNSETRGLLYGEQHSPRDNGVFFKAPHQHRSLKGGIGFYLVTTENKKK